MNRIYWNDQTAMPLSATLDKVLYDIRRDDHGENLLLDAVTEADILEDSDATLTLDALITPYNKLERRMQIVRTVMERTAGEVKPVAMQITQPFRQRGTVNVAVVFELSDGQTISVFFHNPDTTPSRLLPTDELVSWKWLLNKKDVTIVVAPEKGRDLNVREVSRRILRLAEKNSPAFQRANTRRAERLQAIKSLKDEITGLEQQLTSAESTIHGLEAAIEEAREKQRKGLSKAPGAQTEANGGEVSKAEDPNAAVWWESSLAKNFAAVYLIGKSRGKEYLTLTEQSGGIYLAQRVVAGVLREKRRTVAELTEWLRDDALVDMGSAIIGKSMTIDDVRAKLKLVKGEDILFGKATADPNAAAQFDTLRIWQTSADSDPAGGAAVIEAWDSGKADALLVKAKEEQAENAPEFVARKFINDHLQERIVKTKIGDCIINATSKGKLPQAANRKGSVKLEAISRIPEILIDGEVGEMESLYKARADKIDGFYPFTHTLELHDLGKRIKAMIKVGHRNEEQPPLVYSLEAKEHATLDSIDAINGKAPSFPTSLATSPPPSVQGSNGTFTPIVGQPASEFNAVLDAVEESDGWNLVILEVVDLKTGERLHDLEDVPDDVSTEGQDDTQQPDERALIDAYIKSHAEAAAMLNAGIAAVNWESIVSRETSGMEYTKLHNAKLAAKNIINKISYELGEIGVNIYDEDFISMRENKPEFIAWLDAQTAVGKTLAKISAVTKERLIAKGTAAVAALTADTPLAEMATAIFQKEGIDTGDQAPRIVAAIEAKDADSAWSALRNLDNKASAEIFERATGIKLAKTLRDRRPQIDAWAGITPEQRAELEAKRAEAKEAERRDEDLKCRNFDLI